MSAILKFFYSTILVIVMFSMTIVCFAQVSGNFHDSAGRAIKMHELKDKWIVINYWADWCESCVEEIPELNKFYRHNQDKNILIFGVNYDQLPLPYLRQAVHKTGISFPVLYEDPRILWQLGDVTVLPTTFIINPQGDVVKKVIGPNTEQSLLKIMTNNLALQHKNKKAILLG
jgi:thiol-disulfide isomerase/thioredoxin